MTDQPNRTRSLVSSERASTVIFAITAAIVALILFSIVRGFTFYGDEWAFIASRRDFGLEALLRPHNEHWQTLPIFVYQVVFEVRGLAGYGALAAASSAAQLFAATMLFVALRRRVDPRLAVVGALGLMLFAWSDEVLLWPVNLSFSLPVGFGLLALVAWDREEQHPVRDALGTLAMTAALASGGVGLVFWLVATAWLLVHASSRARLLWPAASLLIYLTWYLAYGASGLGDATGFDLALLPSFVAEGLAGLAAPLLGLDSRFRLPSVIVLSVAVGAAITRLRYRKPDFWIPFGGLLSLFALIGVARLAKYDVQGADAPRYLYPAAALAFLALAPIVDALRRAVGPAGRRALWVIVAVWCLVAVAGDAGKLSRSAEAFAERATHVRTELRALQVLRPVIAETAAESRKIDPDLFFGLTPRGYYAAIDDLAPLVSSASAASLQALPPQERELVDALLSRLMHDELVLQPAPSQPTHPAEEIVARLGGLHDLEVLAPIGCPRLAVTGEDPFFGLGLDEHEQLWVRTDGQRVMQVFARVVGDVYRSPASSIYPEPGTWYRLAPAPLVAGLGWTIRIDPPPGSNRVDVCVTSAERRGR